MDMNYRLILQTPSTLSGRDSPIGVEFEDEKTQTLLELLNQISEELTTTKSEVPKRKVDEVRRQFLAPPPPPQTKWPPSTDTKAIIKDTSNKTKSSGSTSKTVTTRSQTLPDIQLTKKATTATTSKTAANQNQNSNKSKKIDELTLSAGKLSSVKKSAPAVPGGARPQHHQTTNVPFSVEMGRAGRQMSYVNKSYISHSNVDFNVVDLDDYESSMMDDISQFSGDH